MEDVLNEWLAKAKKKIEEDEKAKEEIKGFDGVFQLDLTDGESYHIAIKSGEVGELVKGKVDDPRMTVTSDRETLTALMTGEMSPMNAFALRKIKLNGSFEDILRLRKFLKTD
ncbi:MAG: SCP2 sterol-binding domain-containing protein [Methanomassiliicoccales archaeon]|nr:MAG: SCP2 sterol-binding domain-containing protein [Methanomassiliicoccales archaeon]